MTAFAQQQKSSQPPVIKNLFSQSQSHDLVAIVQLDDIDYKVVRGFPRKGSAYLKILIAYKLPEGFDKQEKVEVYDEGLEDFRCYYTDRENDGARFLVFLNKDPDSDRFVGTQPYCNLPVFVSSQFEYALLYPIADQLIEDESIVHTFNFTDQYVWNTTTPLTSTRLDFLKKYYEIQIIGDQFRYTRGIKVEDVRRHLLGITELPQRKTRIP